MISSQSQHSGHREDVLLVMMPGVGQSAFLLSPLLQTSDSSLSMGFMLGFFLHCRAWLHYFILEVQELRGVCVGQRTGSFLSKEPVRPSPPISHQFMQSSATPEQKSQGLGESLSRLLFMFLRQEHFDHFTFNASAYKLPPAFEHDQDLP